MERKHVAIAGAALVTAVFGRMAYTQMRTVLRENVDEKRTDAVASLRTEMKYDSLIANGQLANSVHLITRGPQWRAVDYVVRELIAKRDSKWVKVPDRLFADNHFAQVEERTVDERLPDIFLQRIYFYPTGLNRALAAALGMSTVLERMANPSQTYVVGENQIFLPRELLETISSGQPLTRRQEPNTDTSHP